MSQHDEKIASKDTRKAIEQVRSEMAKGGHYKQRRLLDTLARHGITAGGIGVVVAVLLIFFYLLSVVLPIFESARVEQAKTTHVALPADTVWFDSEEYGELVLAIEKNGSATFYRVHDGAVAAQSRLLDDGQVVGVQPVAGQPNWLAVLSDRNEIRLFKQVYRLSYPNGTRVITPSLEPVFDSRLTLSVDDARVVAFAVFADEETLKIAYALPDQWIFQQYPLEQDFLTEALEVVIDDGQRWQIPANNRAFSMELANDGRWVYLTTESGQILFYEWIDAPPKFLAAGQLEGERRPTAVVSLLGHYSLLVGDDKGFISQWFGYREKESQQLRLAKVREFKLYDAPVVRILPERLRKGFIAVDARNRYGIFYTTSERTLLKGKLPSDAANVAINGRSTKMLVATPDTLHLYHVHNEHPEISWKSLWQKVWYESYPEPAYVWQSSASNNDFEPKFSLSPLAYGTLKAAFYAMLFAVPLALAGAIYTAYFMSPGLRQVVKPTIEIMEALPTVILGFLAGLWLAPFVEKHLPGVIGFLLILPFVTLATAALFRVLPQPWQRICPDGYRPLLLIPVVILTAWLAVGMSTHLELWFFGGNARIWLRDELGVTFDQRNALVVGMAMGFAVIPTIFSIAEDAVFSVPKHLVSGSLALGATPWQTMVRVVLPTASPGIFSALMIGMGRAVGETMIVLMATGNTPVMNMNIFEGMRTLAANIAVEMPESEVGSSHFRVLFLAALVLFAFTFVANTAAELVRQRLREKYSSL